MKTKEEKATYQRAWCALDRERSRAIAGKTAKKNRVSIMARQAVWNSKNPERNASYKKSWAEKHKEQERARKAAYWAANPGKKLFHVRKRQLARIKRTPAWADQSEIRAIYERAAAMRAQGHDVEVDHEIPLCGRLVSGLHIETNLRIILRVDNARKANRFAEDS